MISEAGILSFASVAVILNGCPVLNPNHSNSSNSMTSFCHSLSQTGPYFRRRCSSPYKVNSGNNGNNKCKH